MSLPYNFFQHIDACTSHDPQRFVPFFVGDQSPGAVRRDFAPLLDAIEGFSFEEDALYLVPHPDIPEERTICIEKAARYLSAYHSVSLTGEIYPIIEKWGATPLAEIDRAAIPWFGTRGFGVHANGYVRKPSGLHIWVAQRSTTRKIDPGKLDNFIGGGLPIGLTIEQNLVKEAQEEAGLPEALARSGQFVGSLSYKIDMMKGVRNDTLFIYDIELPEDFMPENTDGEVELFTLMPAEEVLHIVGTTNRFKFNCNLVLIDFFLRHEIIKPDHHAFEELNNRMNALRETP